MPKPFKPTRPFKLPHDAELVDVAGRPHVRLRERGKPGNVATVAVARELAGFLWAATTAP